MKSYTNFIYLNNSKIVLSFVMILLFIPLNTTAQDTTLLTTTTPMVELQNTTTSTLDITITTSALSTSTTTEKIYLCPIALIFAEGKHQQKLLTEFKDKVLAKHKKGVTYTNLYYLNSPEITLIILSNPDIKTHAKNILIKLLPVATALLEKGEAELSQQLIDDMDALLNEVAHKASSKLIEVIKMAKSDIIKKEIFKELGFKITK